MATHSRILHIAHGIPSYHNSLLELANRLRLCEIELITASHNDLSAVLESQKHIFVRLTDDYELELQRKKSISQCNQRPLPARRICRHIQAREYRKRSLHTNEIDRLVEHWNPDLLLIDMECHKVIIQSYRSAIPVILLSRWYSVFRQGDSPPMHTLQIPPISLVDTLRVRLSWVRLRCHKLRLSMQQRLSRARYRTVTYATNSRPALIALAKANGLDLRTISDTSHWLIPHVYNKLPVLSLTAQCMEFDAYNDPRMQYVGAMVGRLDSPHPLYQQSMTEFAIFLKKRKKRNNPLVYCSLSTYWDTNEDILSKVVHLFNARSDLDLVMGLGGRQQMQSLPETGENILLLNYAPQLEVLAHADIAITHGGVSTINEALVNGVPLVVYSSGHVDQNGCTARVVFHGVGLSCKTNPLDTVELLEHVEYILSPHGNKIKDRVSEFQRAQRLYEEENTLVNYLQGVISNKKPDSGTTSVNE